jgi:hypothetical protein
MGVNSLHINTWNIKWERLTSSCVSSHFLQFVA